MTIITRYACSISTSSYESIAFHDAITTSVLLLNAIRSIGQVFYMQTVTLEHQSYKKRKKNQKWYLLLTYFFAYLFEHLTVSMKLNYRYSALFSVHTFCANYRYKYESWSCSIFYKNNPEYWSIRNFPKGVNISIFVLL